MLRHARHPRAAVPGLRAQAHSQLRVHRPLHQLPPGNMGKYASEISLSVARCTSPRAFFLCTLSSRSQVSGSKIWQMERSCMCCQESGEREASVTLFCPKAKPGERKFRKVITKAPLECMCRPCTGVEESAVIPQEIAAYGDEGPLTAHFIRSNQL
ncbi:Hypothetical predicted protein [Cloeon dipterum]|uniref:Bursicon subunit alpha n=1 Tax=Cloeon dipterum TaxID=197152 RepID=A0A8S1CJY3_9INSE|nr:Hypothetical predicted protein [Cloeon dipterum]